MDEVESVDDVSWTSGGVKVCNTCVSAPVDTYVDIGSLADHTNVGRTGGSA